MTVNPTRPPKQKKPSGYWFKLLNKFVESDEECIQLIPNSSEYKDIRVLQTCVASAIHRYKFNLSTQKGDGCVYVIKKIRKDPV